MKSSSNCGLEVLGYDSISVGLLKDDLKSVDSVSHSLMDESFDVMHVKLDVLPERLKVEHRSVETCQ